LFVPVNGFDLIEVMNGDKKKGEKRGE